MIGIAVISKGIETSRNTQKQLKQLLGEEYPVDAYCIDVGFQDDMKDKLVLITSPSIKDFILGKLHPEVKYIIARRSINYHKLYKLLAIPAGTDVLLVNDVEKTCTDTINQLNDLGIDHIKYYPYYLGIENHKCLEVAVTPGESHLAPDCVKQIIDIGTRMLDITTLVEILITIGYLDEKGVHIASQYVKNIVDLSKRYNEAAKQANHMKSMFEAIVENVSDGIIYYDINGEISIVNEVFAAQLGFDKEYIKGKNVFNILPEFKAWKDEDITKDIYKIHGKNHVVANIPIKRDNSIVGYMLSIQDVTEILEIEHELRRKLRKQEHKSSYKFKDILGNSREIAKTIELAKKLATSSSTILIQGESGTGKEFFAQAIHNYSKWKDGPFVPVNFAALPMNLLESELFGYEEGAFTGAKKGGKQGLFEEAHGGTIFLDEIGDSPLELQARLLRVLQEREVRRVGGTKRIPIDVRVIAATNLDLKQLVDEGRFRQDLFFRINVLTLYLPPLRERKGDILLLLMVYLRRLSNNAYTDINSFFSGDTLSFLLEYEWSGNIRELVNIVEYLVNVKEKDHLIQMEDLPAYVTKEMRNKNEAVLAGDSDEITWILRKVAENGHIGRRALALMAIKEGRQLKEARIRKLLEEMQTNKLIQIGKGAAGTSITTKGKALL